MTQADVSASQDTELAFWLENTWPGDPRPLQVLCETCASDAYRLVWVLMDAQSMSPSPAKVWEMVSTAFRLARFSQESLGRFSGARAWLFSLALKQLDRRRAWFTKRAIQTQLQSLPIADLATFPVWTALSGSQIPLSNTIQSLTTPLQRTCILRYLFRLPVSDIANLTGTTTQEVCHRLDQVRLALSQCELYASPGSTLNRPPHPKLLKASTLIEPVPEDLSLPVSHLEGCPECNRFLENLREFENSLCRWMAENWFVQSLPPVIIEKLVILAARGDRVRRKPIPGYVWKLVSGVVIAGLTGLLVWQTMRLESIQNRTKNTAMLISTPTAMPVQSVKIISIPGLDEQNQTARSAQYFTSADLSQNGRWVAYTLITRRLVDGKISYDGNVFLSNRLSSQATLIGASSQAGAPSLSGDGRFVVFASNDLGVLPGENICALKDVYEICSQIYLYDHSIRRLTRISLTSNGGLGNWHSYSPTISPDGRWIIYWSAATNLGDRAPACKDIRMKGLRCWSLYLYDQQTKTTANIPLGRGDTSFSPTTMDPVSIVDRDAAALVTTETGLSITPQATTSGLVLALTVRIGDTLINDYFTDSTSQIVLYDFHNPGFKPVSLNQKGLPGNGTSVSPALSPDGSMLAFASLANDLVENDLNEKADVFVRELATGVTELVSRSSSGEQGNDHSGFFFSSPMETEARIALSEAGRYVVYVSAATNLVPFDLFPCHTGVGIPCLNSFIYDRHEKQITVAVNQPRTNSLYLYPDISADGNWVSLHQVDLECPKVVVCTTIIMFSRLSGSMAEASGVPVTFEALQDQAWQHLATINASWSGLNSLAFSEDGNYLAVGAQDGSLSLFEMEAPVLEEGDPEKPASNYNLAQPVRQYTEHTLPVTEVSFSPDGKLVVSASQDGTLRMYQVENGMLVDVLSGPIGPVLSLAFSPDGKTLSAGGSGRAWSWDMSPGRYAITNDVAYPGLLVERVAYHPSGSLLAQGVSDDTIWLRKSRDYSVVQRLSGHKANLLSLAFSPDGTRLASGDESGQVNIWHIERSLNGEWIVELEVVLQHIDWVNSLAFSPNSELLAVASLGGGVRLWNLSDLSEEPADLGSAWMQAMSLSFSPDGEYLLVGTTWGGVQIWSKR